MTFIDMIKIMPFILFLHYNRNTIIIMSLHNGKAIFIDMIKVMPFILFLHYNRNAIIVMSLHNGKAIFFERSFVNVMPFGILDLFVCNIVTNKQNTFWFALHIMIPSYKEIITYISLVYYVVRI